MLEGFPVYEGVLNKIEGHIGSLLSQQSVNGEWVLHLHKIHDFFSILTT